MKIKIIFGLVEILYVLTAEWITKALCHFELI